MVEQRSPKPLMRVRLLSLLPCRCSPTEEAMVLEAIQCEFDSRYRHQLFYGEVRQERATGPITRWLVDETHSSPPIYRRVRQVRAARHQSFVVAGENPSPSANLCSVWFKCVGSRSLVMTGLS